MEYNYTVDLVNYDYTPVDYSSYKVDLSIYDNVELVYTLADGIIETASVWKF